MSTTSSLIARLRKKLQLDNRTEDGKLPQIKATEKSIPTNSKPEAESTTALVGIGHVGTRYATNVVLQFQAELAVAHAAVAAELEDDWFEKNNILALRSRVTNHREFLLRPDLGRRLNSESLSALQQKAKKNIDVQPILADGLSAVATQGSGLVLLNSFIKECEALGLTVGTPVGVKFARVWLEDEIGQTVNARVAAILLGERPGLGTGDGLSAYLVHDPKIGNTDGNRNMMSNIHQRGTTPEHAAKRLARLAQVMIQQGTSGVSLDLTKEKDLAEASGYQYREPQKRNWLVEVQNDFKTN